MARRTCHLYTIGYAGHSPESFVEALRENNISLLLDVRMTPISRKRGFSKKALHQLLEGAGITYHHIRALGSPAELRRDLYNQGNYETFFASYREHLGSQGDSLRQAATFVASQPVCLMCVEQCPTECHRSVVAEALASILPNPVSVHHISAPLTTKSRTGFAV